MKFPTTRKILLWAVLMIAVGFSRQLCRLGFVHQSDLHGFKNPIRKDGDEKIRCVMNHDGI
jgi:hypothetical protein